MGVVDRDQLLWWLRLAGLFNNARPQGSGYCPAAFLRDRVCVEEDKYQLRTEAAIGREGSQKEAEAAIGRGGSQKEAEAPCVSWESSLDSGGRTQKHGLCLHWGFGLLVAFRVGVTVSCSQDSLSVEDGW